MSSPEFSKPFDLGEKIMYFAVVLVGFGEGMGDLNTDSDQFEYIKRTETGMKILVALMAIVSFPSCKSAGLADSSARPRQMEPGSSPSFNTSNRGSRGGSSRVLIRDKICSSRLCATV